MIRGVKNITVDTLKQTLTIHQHSSGQRMVHPLWNLDTRKLTSLAVHSIGSAT